MARLKISLWCRLGLHRWQLHRTVKSLLFHRVFYPSTINHYKCKRANCGAQKSITHEHGYF